MLWQPDGTDLDQLVQADHEEEYGDPAMAESLREDVDRIVDDLAWNWERKRVVGVGGVGGFGVVGGVGVGGGGGGVGGGGGDDAGGFGGFGGFGFGVGGGGVGGGG